MEDLKIISFKILFKQQFSKYVYVTLRFSHLAHNILYSSKQVN